MGQTERAGLSRGERAPDFALPLVGGPKTRFYSRAGGRPAVLVFVDTAADTDAALHAAGDGASRHLVMAGDGDGVATVSGADLFVDDGTVRKAYRLGQTPGAHAFVLDRNLRVIDGFGLAADDRDRRLQTALEEASATEVPRTVTAGAPVLFVPRVLDPGLCAHLMAVWEREPHEETGVERSVAGARQEVIAEDTKRRRDHVVEEPTLTRGLTHEISRRVLREVQGVFAYSANRLEGFKIACYESSTDGFFDAHRDNLSPSTAHRRFAVSLNLNDDYRGGELRFPEHGEGLYRPAAGEALVFSCGLLHEVVPVTEGRRFTLLTFLFRQDQ